MGDSPSFWNPETAELRLDDVNGDGLDDLVSVRFDAIDVWLNVDGVGWTKDRHTFFGTPKAPEGKNRVRLVALFQKKIHIVLFPGQPDICSDRVISDGNF